MPSSTPDYHVLHRLTSRSGAAAAATSPVVVTVALFCCEHDVAVFVVVVLFGRGMDGVRGYGQFEGGLSVEAAGFQFHLGGGKAGGD